VAGTSLLVLLDDIAAVLDDVSLMTKVAAKKTAGVLGDDLAVNAEKVTGVDADRELPVVWAVAKGSFRNKLILVPVALLLAAFAPWMINPILMLGGLYLCFEGFEKVYHSLLHRKQAAADRAQILSQLANPKLDPLQIERSKISGAIRTDFILSAEIIVITLGIVADSAFVTQVAVVAGVALLMTVAVYGLVAAIVKLDDAGLYLSRRSSVGRWPAIQRWLGYRLLDFAPLLMKLLAVVGTAAMFLVGGGILVHGIHILDDVISHMTNLAATIHIIGPLAASLTSALMAALIGVVAGGLVMLAKQIAQFLTPTTTR